MPNWSEVLKEIHSETLKHRQHSPLDQIRKKYLIELFNKTGRNIIAYYSGFLSKPNINGSDINDEDKNGFMMAVHGMNKNLGLDLILHTPGGNIAAAESIVDYLNRIFGRNIRAIVPQIAMSAGTMIALSCKSILMGKHSNLGPIDPQLNGVPAAGVIEEFKNAYNEISKDPNKVAVWQHIIRQYPPSFLGQCENAVNWAKEFVEVQLLGNMLSEHPRKKIAARKIVNSLTDFTGNRGHDRHIHIGECLKLEIAITLLEEDDELQDLVLTVHHCFMNSLSNTQVFKIIENHKGDAFMKQQVPVAMPIPFGGMPP